MEEHWIEENAILPNSEERSLEEFKQNVLGSMNESEFGDSFSTVARIHQLYVQNITMTSLKDFFTKHYGKKPVYPNAFYNSFQSKFLSDFSNSIDSDASRRFIKCTTHVKSLSCDLKTTETAMF